MSSPLTKVGRGSPLRINWEMVSHCQNQCSYCYYKPFKSKTPYSSLAKLIVKKISMIEDPLKLTLLGGEPTLHPDFFTVVKSLHELTQVESLTIVTNFQQPLDFWQKLLQFKDKLKLSISFHAEHPQSDAFSKIKLLQNDFLLDLVFIVHNNPVFFPQLKTLAMKAQDFTHKDVTINFMKIHQTLNGSLDYLTYPEEINNFINEQNQKNLARKNTEHVNIMDNSVWTRVPKFELLEKELNRFHGWTCKLRAFIIHEDGMVSSACSSEKKYILLQSFKEKTLLCTYKICECDDYWEFPKNR